MRTDRRTYRQMERNTDRQTGRRTDRHGDATIAFRNFSKAPKTEQKIKESELKTEDKRTYNHLLKERRKYEVKQERMKQTSVTYQLLRYSRKAS